MSILGYVLIAFCVVAYCVWFLVVLENDKFRGVSNEVWGVYWLNILKYAWPYVLIYAVYKIIQDGSLATVLRAASR